MLKYLLMGGVREPTYELWGVGYNQYGSLGQSNNTNYSSPVQIGSYHVVDAAAGSNFGCYILDDGTMWGSGYDNNTGQCGLGVNYPTSSPGQLGSSSDWARCSGGGALRAVKNDGTLWAWGSNNRGQLGLGHGTDNTTRTPTQVGALTDWDINDKATNHGSGYEQCYIKDDGQLWMWGENLYGTFGLSTITRYSSPVTVGSPNEYDQVATGANHMILLKPNGTIWASGRNGTWGALGNGSTTDLSSPVQIGTSTDWVKVRAFDLGCFAINAGGELYSWGHNWVGQQGHGDTTYRSTPTQVGALTDWDDISSAQAVVRAIKTDGTVWAWGHNDKGGLGDGSSIDRSSPVQVWSGGEYKYTTRSSHQTSYLLKEV